ncbi:response regulator [Halonotius terrestris]|uniref:Response regulator n=1 Tax=Halonotius terrestris TaxID=2487750 RepID=A0A8J8PAM1_9EURY|nr:response regulator [Halonotius terrestris]TQQ82956.1 response regulator [Halonotius terrestris]
MSQHSESQSTVLIADDEPDVVSVYAARLDDDYEVREAYNGREALDALDASVDVLLLDRRMPGITGDEVLESVREDGYDCRVIMVTAIDPDLDIVDMPFDDYLCKPVSKDTLLDAIEKQLTASEYSKTLRELFRATAKLGVLRAEKPPADLEDAAEFQRLEARVESLRAEQTELLAELDDFEAAFNAIDRVPHESL